MKQPSYTTLCISGVLLIFLAAVGFSEEGQATLQERLSATTLDALDYRGATVQDVVAHLKKHLSPQDKDPLRIIFEVMPSPDSTAETETRITLVRRNISMLDAINAVAEEGNLRIRFDEDLVTFVSFNPHDEEDAKESEEGETPDAKAEWDATQPPLRMQVSVNFASDLDVDTTNSPTIPDTSPLMLSIQMLPTQQFKCYRRQALSVMRMKPPAEQRPAHLATVSYAAKDGAHPLAVTVQQCVGDVWKPFAFPGGNWVVLGAQDISQAYATRLHLLHTGLFPRKLPQGRYQITVTCEYNVETGEDAKLVDSQGDVILNVAEGDLLGARQSCAISWLYFMLELAGQKADSKLKEQLSAKLDEWLQLCGPMNGADDIRHAKTIGMLAAQLGKYDVAYSYLLEYLLYPHENRERAYTAARHVFNRVCVDMGRENPLHGIGYQGFPLEERTE